MSVPQHRRALGRRDLLLFCLVSPRGARDALVSMSIIANVAVYLAGRRRASEVTP